MGGKIIIDPDLTEVLYIDKFKLIETKDGLIIDFAQKDYQTDRTQIVSSVGMTNQQVKYLTKQLSKHLKSAHLLTQNKEKNNEQ